MGQSEAQQNTRAHLHIHTDMNLLRYTRPPTTHKHTRFSLFILPCGDRLGALRTLHQTQQGEPWVLEL